MMSRDLSTIRDAIATYVMVKPDSTLMDQVVTALKKRDQFDGVSLCSGDRFVTGLVSKILQAADIEVEVHAGTEVTGSSKDRPFQIDVPNYMASEIPGRMVFNKDWDRPMIVAQAVGDSLQKWSGSVELKLSSRWLWWAMSYRMWQDIDNMRNFVRSSIDLACTKGWQYVDESEILREFAQNNRLEQLFKVDVDLTLDYMPRWEGQQPVVRIKRGKFATDMGIDEDERLIDRVWDNWGFSLHYCSDVVEIALRLQEGGPTQRDAYVGYAIDPKDTLLFLRNIEWWEKRIGERHPDDISGLVNDIGPHVQRYCRERWSESMEKIAKSMGLTRSKLRQWVTEMHLDTEFGGEQDGYEQWVRAREGLIPTKVQPAPADSSAASKPKKYRLKLRSDTREVTVNDHSYPQCPLRAFKALTYALERRKKKRAEKYFNRRDLCTHLRLGARESMYDIFKGTPFYGRKAEPRLILTAKIHSGKHSKNEYHLDVDVEGSEIKL